MNMAQCKYSGCTDEALPDRKMCLKHKEQMAEYGRKRRALLASEGRCPLCGGKPAKGRKYCLDCLSERAAANAASYRRRAKAACAHAKQKREEHRAAGLCWCGKPVAPGKKSCPKCLRHYVKSINQRRQRRFNEGMCIICGKQPALPDRKIGACCRKVVTVRKPTGHPLAHDHPWYQQYKASIAKARFKREQREKQVSA